MWLAGSLLLLYYTRSGQKRRHVPITSWFGRSMRSASLICPCQSKRSRWWSARCDLQPRGDVAPTLAPKNGCTLSCCTILALPQCPRTAQTTSSNTGSTSQNTILYHYSSSFFVRLASFKPLCGLCSYWQCLFTDSIFFFLVPRHRSKEKYSFYKNLSGIWHIFKRMDSIQFLHITQ